VRGRVVLTGRITDACSVLKGVVRAKRARLKRRFTAALQRPPTFTTGDFTPAPLAQATVGAAGGTVSVTDPASPLNGLAIVVPPGSTTDDVTFTVSSAPITDETGLPAGTHTASRLIRIEANGSAGWNEDRQFTRAVRLTLPYEPPAEGEETVRFYAVTSDGSLDAAGLDGQDTANHTLTFYTRTFGDAPGIAPAITPQEAGPSGEGFTYYVAVGMGALLSTPFAVGIDTGFRPDPNGWAIPNYGSYYKDARGGSCAGFATSAQWYYRKRYQPPLGENPRYIDPKKTPSWVDDAVAIEFTSRVQDDLAQIWEQFRTRENSEQVQSSRAVALSLLGALYVTGQPALVGLRSTLAQADGSREDQAGHAVPAYRVEIKPGGSFRFYVYDSNYPSDDSRFIDYDGSTGFKSYPDGTTLEDSRHPFNEFRHRGYRVFLNDAHMERLKTLADGGFKDTSYFPKIEITSIKAKNKDEVVFDRAANVRIEGTTKQNEHKFITSDRAVIIEGTVLGGLAQDPCCVVNSLNLYMSGKRYGASVNNRAGGGDGRFSVTVPVDEGENELVILAAHIPRFSDWAGFHRDVIESTASNASMIVTLVWDQDRSDVDLYVKEPDRDGKTGDTVYYSHRRGESDANPFLDLDNTSGAGTEHYFARRDSVTLYSDGSAGPDLYGKYTVRAHYYADHDDQPDTTQPISYTILWRYLAYCPAPCTNPVTDGVYIEGSSSGSLTAANSGNCCSIGNASGGDWSPPIEIDYKRPDPADYVAKDPSTVMLP
jgi:hypothetical protein